MRTLVVIPARLAATRLPRKPLRLLAGAPLIVRVWQRVSEMRVADACVVATDEPEVDRAVRAAGADCVMTRSDHESGTERVAEVAAMQRFAGFSTIVNVQGDEPFVGKSSVEQAAGLVSSGRFPIATSASTAPWTIADNPAVVKVVVADDGRALYFSRSGIPHLRDPRPGTEPRARMLQHVGVYAYSRPALEQWVSLPQHPLEEAERLEQLRPLAAGMPIGVAITEDPSAGGIDTEEDLARANAQWNALTAG